jgi:hypothetical protein
MVRKGKLNPNWKGGKIEKRCVVCGTLFHVFPSQQHIKTCTKPCSDELRKINSRPWNKGLTKETSETMRKISLLKKGVKRTNICKKNISDGTKRGMHKPENWKRFIEGNKKRNKDFFQSPEWVEKNMKSRQSNKYLYHDIEMRSNWEVLYAGWLDQHGLEWEYEPMVTRLKSIGMCYCPDFYVKEWKIFVEVKGYLSPEGKLKIEAFKKKFGEDKLLVVDENKMKEIGLI